MPVTVRVLSNDFPKMSAAAKRGIAKGFASAKGPVLADMQRRTPVDRSWLRDSETAESDDTSLTLTAGGGEHDVDYALYVHNGARGRAPRRFMTDAIEAGMPGIVNALADGIASEMS